MKFINYLESITGVGIYPMISLLIFFIFFVVLFIAVFRMDKQKINQVSQVPLNDEL